jgi:uncharacterized membrane protein
MYCTTLHLQKRMVYGTLCLLLLIGLLLRSLSLVQEQEGWHEALVPCLRRKGVGRRSYHALVVRLALLKRRGAALFCRLSLMAVLLVWSGWPQRQPCSWALLSLPLANAIISLLPLYWPGVLKGQAYAHLIRGTDHLYRLVLVVLFSEGSMGCGRCGGASRQPMAPGPVER